MDTESFIYQLPGKCIIFTDTIKKENPYIAKRPRDHESIFLVTNGSLLYEREGVRQVIAAGQIGYIPRGSVDCSSAFRCEAVSYIAINFSFDTESRLPKKTLCFDTLCSLGTAHPYETLFRQGLHHYLPKAPGYQTVCNGIVMQIIGLLYNEHATKSAGSAKQQQIANAIDYLQQNYARADFKISEMAQHVNMSEKHFRRIFWDVYRTGPYAFLQTFRVNRAEILLLNSPKSISDIALECGFCDIYSFSHSFKSHTGLSPSQYRNRTRTLSVPE